MITELAVEMWKVKAERNQLQGGKDEESRNRGDDHNGRGWICRMAERLVGGNADPFHDAIDEQDARDHKPPRSPLP